MEHDSFDESCAREDADADADEERDMRRSSDTHTYEHTHAHARARALALTQRERNAFLRTKEWRKISTQQKHIYFYLSGKKKRGI